MNKPACLGLSILELSNINVLGILMYYVKPKYGGKINCVIWIQIVSLYT